MRKKVMDAKANRSATIVIVILSIAIMRIIKKYGKEQKD